MPGLVLEPCFTSLYLAVRGWVNEYGQCLEDFSIRNQDSPASRRAERTFTRVVARFGRLWRRAASLPSALSLTVLQCGIPGCRIKRSKTLRRLLARWQSRFDSSTFFCGWPFP